MILPKDCIMITRDEAKTLLSLLGVKSFSFPWEAAQQVTEGGTDAETRVVYNLITVVKKLEEAAYNRCYDCTAYNPAD